MRTGKTPLAPLAMRRSPADVAALLSQVQYAGLTPLATCLQSKVLQPIVYSLAARGGLAKPVLVITITDGEPTDTPKDLVAEVVREARARLAAQYGPKAVAFEFCQGVWVRAVRVCVPTCFLYCSELCQRCVVVPGNPAHGAWAEVATSQLEAAAVVLASSTPHSRQRPARASLPG